MTTPLLELTEVNEADFPSAADLNDSLWALDVIVQLSVISQALVEPPAGATQGMVFIVPALGATGAWVGQERRIAYLTPDGWKFRTPKPYWVAYVADEDTNYRYTGTAWEEDTTSGGGGPGGDSDPNISPRGATWARAGIAIAVPVDDVRIYFPFACTIVGVVVLTGELSGDCVIDILKDTFGTYPPSVSICAAAKPTISSARTYLDMTLTGWTTAIAAGDVIAFRLESSSAFKSVHCALLLEKVPPP